MTLLSRFTVPCVVVFVVVLGLPACNPLDLCGSVPLAITAARAAERATSCAFSVSYAGREYGPWCQGVHADRVLDAPRLSGRHLGNEYEARLIDGVPSELAIAVAGPGLRKGKCGRWRFAPAWDLDRAEAQMIAERVSFVGTPGSN